MADQHSTNQVTPPTQAADMERAKMDKNSSARDIGVKKGRGDRPPRPDPETGEVPAGPGDAGRQDRPELNTGSPGTRQMSNRRLVIGLSISALLAVLVLIFAALL